MQNTVAQQMLRHSFYGYNKKKPRNHCGFWVFEVLDEKQIISWRTEVHDVQPSDRTTSNRKVKSLRAIRTFWIAFQI